MSVGEFSSVDEQVGSHNMDSVRYFKTGKRNILDNMNNETA